MARKASVFCIVLCLAASSAFAAEKRKGWVPRARENTRLAFRAVGRQFRELMGDMHTSMQGLRNDAATATGKVVRSGRHGIDSFTHELSAFGRRTFAGTRTTLRGFTHDALGVGEREAPASATIIARDITSDILSTVFLRRHDIVLAWRTSTGGRPIRKSYILDDRVLFEDTAGEVYSFNPRNGIAQWVFPLPKPSQVGWRHDGDHVFITANDTFFEIDRRVGLPRRRIVFKFPVCSTPAVTDEMVVIGSWDRRVYALSRENRVKQWTFIPVENAESGVALDPSFAFVAESNGKVSAYSPQQRRAVWEYKADDGIRVDLVTTTNHIIFPADDLAVHAINRFGGFRSWKFPTRGPVTRPVWATDERCYFAADGDAFYAMDLFKGSLLWRVPEAGWPVAIGKENLYLEGPDKSVWACDLKTGERRWAMSAAPFTFIAGNSETDHIYLCSDKGDIYALYIRGDHLLKRKPVLPKPEVGKPGVPDIEKPTPKKPGPRGAVTPTPTPRPKPSPKPTTKKPAGGAEEEDW